MKTNPEQPDSKPEAQAFDLVEQVDKKLQPGKSIEENNETGKSGSIEKERVVSLPPLPPKHEVYPAGDRIPSPQRKKQNSFQGRKKPQVLKAEVYSEKQNFARASKGGFSLASIPQPWLAWQIGAAALVMIFGGIGFTATSFLLKIPEVANCDRVYLPLASASLRLYCAELVAKEENADSLLSAIAMVENLPARHPLRSEINRKIEGWAEKILDLGEAQFQAGALDRAITIAESTPKEVEAYQLVENRIKKWRKIWSEAETLDLEARKYLISSQWYKAFNSARKLTDIENQYWSQQRYQEILTNIKQAQQESSKLDLAYSKLKDGSLENLIQAIEKADRIDSDSYAYREALQIIDEAKAKLIAQMDRSISQGNWQQVLQIANRIPPSAELEDYVKDWNYLATAGSSARIGTISSIKSAIETAQKIDPQQPLHRKAQQLIGYWKLEIKDIEILTRARRLARSGGINDLRQAISVARSISRYNPRYLQAQKEINSWVYRIQVAEDRPILNGAYQIARGGDTFSLQQAISRASAIRPNRALYREAQNQIGKWRYTIETTEDNPILLQAETAARRGDFRAAIAIARQISPGRALYSRSQNRVSFWQQELQGQEAFRRADNMARSGTGSALVRAISLARQVPAASSLKTESNRSINRWSEQLFNIAKKTAPSSLTRAINLARSIPPQAAVYTLAREQIATWQNQLNQKTIVIPDSGESQ